MAESKKRRKKAVAIGAAGVAIFGGLFATALAVDAGSGGAPAASTGVAAGGYVFANAAMDAKVLTISGDAPDASARDGAFLAGVDAVKADRAHVGQVLAFSNAITVAGQAVASVPDAASALGDRPQAEACQTAYDTLLDGRVINFNSGSALISQDSTQLLDALSAVAMRCLNYRLEVAGHTDLDGDATANQALSERRAQAVADYLVRKGVDAAQLGVMGLGETRPVDPADSEDADAKNRRIEFKVAAQAAP
jgi:outer membrane protein OmpA-like peptidoglycan-associated protein